MIIDKEVDLVMNNFIKKYYINLGYNVPKKRNSIIKIKIKDLQLGSNVKISCKCKFCDNINKISYEKYIKNINKYGFYSCKKCSRIKFKMTCKEKYNVKNPFQNDNIKEKSKNTLLEKFGVDNISKLNSTKELHKKRNLFLYGVENYFQSDDFKEKSKITLLEKFGTDNVFKSEKIKNKIKKHYYDKYGVEYPSQVEEIHIKQQKSGFAAKKYKELYYRGTYELDFLKNFYDIGIENGKTIKYLFKNQEKVYFSDFYYKPLNLIIEIKSWYTYKKYLHQNIIKENACLNQKYNYIKIIDKNYDDFLKILEFI